MAETRAQKQHSTTRVISEKAENKMPKPELKSNP